MVGRVSLEDPVFDDGDIAVGALGDNIPRWKTHSPHPMDWLSRRP